MKRIKWGRALWCGLMAALVLCACASRPVTLELAGTETAPVPGGAESTDAGVAETPQGTPLELGSDVYAFRVQVEQAVLALPCPVGRLAALGWQPEADLQAVLPPGQSAWVTCEKEGGTLRVLLANTETDAARPMEHCPVVGIAADGGAPVALPEGVAVGTDRDAVLALCGRPDDGDEQAAVLRYTAGRGAHIQFWLDDTGAVTALEMINPRPLPALPLPEALPQKVAEWQAPGQLGEDWRSLTVRYAGALYSLPAPVYAFLQNGWVLQDEKQMAPGQWMRGVSLRKGNQVLRTTLYNLSDEETGLAGCYVTMVESGSSLWLPLELPGGITTESNYEEIVAVMGEPDENFRYNSRMVTYYVPGGKVYMQFAPEDMTLFDLEVWYLP